MSDEQVCARAVVTAFNVGRCVEIIPGLMLTHHLNHHHGMAGFPWYDAGLVDFMLFDPVR
jgi:hypothetical protein